MGKRFDKCPNCRAKDFDTCKCSYWEAFHAQQKNNQKKKK
jgi:hypothetical protein